MSSTDERILPTETPLDVYTRAVRRLMASAYAARMGSLARDAPWPHEVRVQRDAFRVVAAWLAMRGDPEAQKVVEMLRAEAEKMK